MHKILFTFFILFSTFYLVSCSKDENKMTKEQRDKAKAFSRISDSLKNERLKMMHKNFVGKHRHQRDLAVHAHQNVPAKRRRAKSAARTKARKEAIARKQKEAQIKLLKEKGLYKENSENQEKDIID